MKKFFSLVLALVMALSLTTVAWGAEATKVGTADALVEALENKEDVVFTDNIKIDPAAMSNAYGTTGINVKNGQTIDGGNYTLDIKGAGGTWDSGINTTGGTIKNITITGSFRGIFINHNSDHSEKVVLENVTTTGTTYTISCDQGLNQGLEATNCAFYGWTSYAGTLGSAVFTNCTFGEGSGYKFCRPYAPTTFVGCDFVEGYTVDPRATITFEDCTLDGVALTAKNLETLVTASNIKNATVLNSAAPEGDTATAETTTNVAENVQSAVKDAVTSDPTGTTVTAGETKIEFNDVAAKEAFADADTADITTKILAEDVTETVDAAVVTAVEALVEEQVGEIGADVEIAAYVEIDIHVFADGEHVGQITELPEKIKVSIPLPAGVTAEAGKKYYVAHEHDGVVELLPAAIEGEYLVFYSDTFSTYAVVTQSAPTTVGAALTEKVDMVTTDAAQTKYPNVSVTVHKANAPKDTNKDGRFDVSGNVKYFMMNGQEFVQVNTVSEADYTVYVAGTKTLFGYFKAANPFYYGYGVPFNNFGDKCGQYDDEPEAGVKYYTFETNLYKAVKAGAEDFNLMVGNELVPVELMSDEWVEHVAAYTYDKNYKVVGVKCAECGAPATLVPNFASLPKNIQKGVQGVDYFAIGDGQYYYWQAASVAPETKVESAETFDAGIAMYVGMSVMAAAGSAVVIGKKKD